MPSGEGWFVLNARTARWIDNPGRGRYPTLQGRGDFAQLGLGLTVLEPGEPMAMYHWETDQEDFLVLSGEALLIVEGAERPLRQWDFVHCPPGTQHVIVGAGDGPCVVFAVGALERHTTGSRVDGTLEGTDDGGAYTADEAASGMARALQRRQKMPPSRTLGFRSPSRRGTATAGFRAPRQSGHGRRSARPRNPGSASRG